MDDYSLRLAKPHCESCHRPKIEEIEAELIQQPSSFVGANPMDVIADKISLANKLAATIQAAQASEENDEDEI